MLIEVKVLYFGRLRELVGRSEESATIPEGAPISQLFTNLGSQYPQIVGFRSSVVASRNREFASWNSPLQAGDEIAFLPPVSGG
jgi:molybdopterin converting factor subunit 1